MNSWKFIEGFSKGLKKQGRGFKNLRSPLDQRDMDNRENFIRAARVAGWNDEDIGDFLGLEEEIIREIRRRQWPSRSLETRVHLDRWA